MGCKVTTGLNRPVTYFFFFLGSAHAIISTLACFLSFLLSLPSISFFFLFQTQLVVRMDQAKVEAGSERVLSITGPGHTVLLQTKTVDDATTWMSFLSAAAALMA